MAKRPSRVKPLFDIEATKIALGGPVISEHPPPDAAKDVSHGWWKMAQEGLQEQHTQFAELEAALSELYKIRVDAVAAIKADKAQCADNAGEYTDETLTVRLAEHRDAEAMHELKRAYFYKLKTQATAQKRLADGALARVRVKYRDLTRQVEIDNEAARIAQATYEEGKSEGKIPADAPELVSDYDAWLKAQMHQDSRQLHAQRQLDKADAQAKLDAWIKARFSDLERV